MPPWPLIDPFQFPVWTVARENANYQIFRCWVRRWQCRFLKMSIEIKSSLRSFLFCGCLSFYPIWQPAVAQFSFISSHLLTQTNPRKGRWGCVVPYQLDRRFLEFDSPLFATAHKKGKQVVGVGFHQTPLLSLRSNLSLCTPFLHFKHQPFDIGVRNMFSYACFHILHILASQGWTTLCLLDGLDS